MAGPLTGQGGTARAFAEFSLLPDLMALARESTGRPLAPLWTEFLEEVGCSLDHVEEPDRPNGRSVWRWMAEDAIDLSVRLGLLRRFSDGDCAVDAAGAAVASMADAPMEARREDEDGELRSMLAQQMRALYLGNGGIDVSSLLLKAASAMRRTKHVWAQQCPGLLLVEFDALVHEAENDRAGAERLLDQLEENRDLAMHPIGRPGPARGPDDNAIIHADAVADFYLFDLEQDSRSSLTITGARASAMLFTFAGLLAEGVPLGPVQMLVPPSAQRGWRLSVPVELRQGDEWGGRPAPATAAGLLLQLLSKDPMAVGRAISSRLDLHSRVSLSGRLRGAQERDDLSLLTIKDYRSINKALSMELLCGSLLAHLDDPGGVVSLCCSDRGRPYNFAPAGLPDLTAEYDPHIRLVAEVSAKSNASAGFQRSQLDQALRYANDELVTDGVDVVYALVVNRGDFGGDPELQSLYSLFVSENELAPDGSVRLVPMSGNDLAAVLINLSEHHPGAGMGFSSAALQHGFDEIINALLQPEQPATPGWMADLLVRSARGDWGWNDGSPPPPPSSGLRGLSS